MADVTPTDDKDVARRMRLGAPSAPVARVSRKVLMIMGGVASVAVIGAIAWAMARKPHGKDNGELFNTSGQHPPDAMAALPKDYANLHVNDAPKLGPPLPGDLGRPMLTAGQAGSSPLAGTGNGPSSQSADQAQQRSAQDRQAARTSSLFTDTGGVHAATAASDMMSAAGVVVGAPAPVPAKGSESSAAANSNGQGSKLAFLNAPADRTTTSGERLQAPISPYVVQAGTVIPAALITGLRSDLPGQITAQVTENVFDSPSGRYLLIPQGSRLVGEYDSQVSFGQSRVLLAWTRLILPGGRSIVLEKQPGADEQGFAGLQDGVDHHWKQLFGAALLSTVMGVGAQAGASESDSEIVQALRQGAANSLNQAGQQVVAKNLDVQPTLLIRPGFPVRVVVTRDLVLEPINL